MDKIIIEVSSTCTKVNKFDGNNIVPTDISMVYGILEYSHLK